MRKPLIVGLRIKHLMDFSKVEGGAKRQSEQPNQQAQPRRMETKMINQRGSKDEQIAKHCVCHEPKCASLLFEFIPFTFDLFDIERLIKEFANLLFSLTTPHLRNLRQSFCQPGCLTRR